MDTVRELLFSPNDLRTLVVWFFALRLGLPTIVSIVLGSFTLKRELTVSEERLIQQRLSRLVLASMLVAVSLRALSTAKWLAPWESISAESIFATRAMMWYLIADSLDLLFSYFMYRTPAQLDLWFHHIVLFGFLIVTTPTRGANVNALAFLGELMALFSGSVFFLSVLDPKTYPWAAPALRVASVGRKVALFSRFGIWIYVLWLFHAVAVPSPVLYRQFVTGCLIAFSLDVYWGMVFFGVLKGRNELKKD